MLLIFHLKEYWYSMGRLIAFCTILHTSLSVTVIVSFTIRRCFLSAVVVVVAAAAVVVDVVMLVPFHIAHIEQFKVAEILQ